MHGKHLLSRPQEYVTGAEIKYGFYISAYIVENFCIFLSKVMYAYDDFSTEVLKAKKISLRSKNITECEWCRLVFGITSP